MIVGAGNNREVKPIAPFSKNTQVAPYQRFIDYKTGELYKGTQYWRSLFDVLKEYRYHPEAKLEGEQGLLERKNVTVTGLRYIGKETL